MLLDIAQNRPREQGFDAWQASAEVKAGLARFFTADALITMRQKCSKNPTAFGFLELFLIFEGEFCAKRPFARIEKKRRTTEFCRGEWRKTAWNGKRS